MEITLSPSEEIRFEDLSKDLKGLVKIMPFTMVFHEVEGDLGIKRYEVTGKSSTTPSISTGKQEFANSMFSFVSTNGCRVKLDIYQLSKIVPS